MRLSEGKQVDEVKERKGKRFEVDNGGISEREEIKERGERIQKMVLIGV